MQKTFFYFSLLVGFGLFTAFAGEKPVASTFKVSGNCGMCKSRIEQVLAVPGVRAVEWNQETRLVTVRYMASKITLEKLEALVAAAGHDTDKVKANDATYQALPSCCHYRKS
jgi:periplasmic mercuric ion binding protein